MPLLFDCINDKLEIMARPKNTAGSVQITITTTPQVKALLEELAESGFYGKNAADTAHSLLKEKIRELQREGQAPGLKFATTEIPSNPRPLG